MKYHLITYGCQMNVADSEEMARPLMERGLRATSDLDEADIVVMNTCTVREQAEHRAKSNLGRLKYWKKQDPNRILVVAGCAASRWGESIKKQYPFIDLVSPATRIERFPELITQTLKERWNWEAETSENFRDNVVCGNHLTTPSRNLFGSESTAYVTIMRGCNYRCSYCIVPQVRGRETYRPMPQILDDVREKVAAGRREVMLLGQTVNSYHWREQASGGNPQEVPGSPIYDFADLLRAVNVIPGIERIRFMSPHPKHMSDRLIQTMADCPKVARHIHLPVQSGSDQVLSSMKRLYTRPEYVKIVSKLKAAIPGLLMTTDLIVGYPGEMEEDFLETLALMEKVRFNGLFVFKYSSRPGTAAAGLVDDVPPKVKEERLQKVHARFRELSETPPRAWAS